MKEELTGLDTAPTITGDPAGENFAENKPADTPDTGESAPEKPLMDERRLLISVTDNRLMNNPQDDPPSNADPAPETPHLKISNPGVPIKRSWSFPASIKPKKPKRRPGAHGTKVPFPNPDDTRSVMFFLDRGSTVFSKALQTDQVLMAYRIMYNKMNHMERRCMNHCKGVVRDKAQGWLYHWYEDVAEQIREREDYRIRTALEDQLFDYRDEMLQVVSEAQADAQRTLNAREWEIHEMYGAELQKELEKQMRTVAGDLDKYKGEKERLQKRVQEMKREREIYETEKKELEKRVKDMEKTVANAQAAAETGLENREQELMKTYEDMQMELAKRIKEVNERHASERLKITEEKTSMQEKIKTLEEKISNDQKAIDSRIKKAVENARNDTKKETEAFMAKEMEAKINAAVQAQLESQVAEATKQADAKFKSQLDKELKSARKELQKEFDEKKRTEGIKVVLVMKEKEELQIKLKEEQEKNGKMRVEAGRKIMDLNAELAKARAGTAVTEMIQQMEAENKNLLEREREAAEKKVREACRLMKAEILAELQEGSEKKPEPKELDEEREKAEFLAELQEAREKKMAVPKELGEEREKSKPN